MSPAAIKLQAQDIRIDSQGVCLCDALSLSVSGSRIVLAGSTASALVGALIGTHQVVAGSLSVDGHSVDQREHFAVCGLAPADLPMPHDMIAADYIAMSYELAGASSRQAPNLAKATLDVLRLSAFAPRHLATLSLAERRVVAIASAMTPSATSIVVETPLASLEGSAARMVLATLGAATNKYAVITSVCRLDPDAFERELVLGADLVAIVDGRRAAWQGHPQDLLKSSTLYAITVYGQTDDFVACLANAGHSVSGQAPHLTVALAPDTTTTALLCAGRDTKTTIVRCEPLWVAQDNSAS